MEIAITVLLVLLATVLLTVEIVFSPGFGVAGIVGVITMLASVFYAFFVVGNIAGWITVIVLALLCVALFLWALYGKSLDKLALKKNISSKVNEIEEGRFAVGDRGVARTRLALIGEAEINGVVVEVKSERGFINENEQIEIIRISGPVLYVKRAGDE